MKTRRTIVTSGAFILILLATVATGGTGVTASPRLEPPPRLVLFITIDQLRGDVLPRVAPRLGPDGFRRLLDHGVHYTNAHYLHATTHTACGHATLFTGGNPPEHGLAGNEWGTRDGQRVYCVEDARHTLVGATTSSNQAGTSPRNLTSSTIGDELVVSSGRRSRVFSVSIKDRGAILPGGHLGTAFWYSSGIGGFITSTYYADELPAWVKEWNEADPVAEYEDTQWTLLRDPSWYVQAAYDDRPYEVGYRNLGRVFPHPLESTEQVALALTIRYTPYGDELTLSFVETLLEKERLGRDTTTDLLAVSFSSTDYVGHAFGPNSLEAEDNLLRLDRTIARLLSAVDESVGLDRTIVVLSSDHGVDTVPEHRHELACGEAIAVTVDEPLCGNAGRLDPRRVLATANIALRAQFDVEVDLVASFWNPGVYLQTSTIESLGLDVAEVEMALATHLRTVPGIADAVTRTDLLVGKIGVGPLATRVQRAFHPTRSGNVVIVPSASWFVGLDPTGMSATHGSPYSYDTHVPIVVVVPGGAASTVTRPVAPRDIAPTLAMLLRIEPPTGSVGTPLEEVVSPAPPTGDP